VYQGDNPLGEVEIFLSQNNLNNDVLKKGTMRISHCSQASERCPPLAVLHTITSSGLWFKMMEAESSSYGNKSLYFQQQDSPLLALHSTCIRENKVILQVMNGEHVVEHREYSRSSSIKLSKD